MMRRALLAMSGSERLARSMTTNRLAWSAAHRFVAGDTLAQAIDVVAGLNAAGLAACLDHLGENTSRRSEAEAARDAYLDAVARIRQSGVHAGVSLKLTSLGLGLEPNLARDLLRQIVAAAAALDPPVFVRIDMEDSPRVQATLDTFHALFGEYRNLGVVLQSCLYRSEADAARLADIGAGVRLVKGAYLEPHTVAYPKKADVDAAFLRLCEQLLSPEALAKGTYLAIATHDERIIDWAKRYAAAHGIPPEGYEYQMLHGVRRDLQLGLVREGYRVRVYVPYGSQWYPYFMRRLAERPQNVAFLVRNLVRELLP
jgi:proline dehydrogenase